jgi:sialic acid synthase SpsE
MKKLDLVVEMSGAHGGSLENAIRIVDAAAAAGATAIKTQLFNPWHLAHMRSTHPRIIDMGYTESSLIELYKTIFTPTYLLPKIRDRAHECGLEWYSSFFHPNDAKILLDLGSTRLKMASFEYSDSDLYQAAANTQLPLIVSVPMNGWPQLVRRISKQYSIKLPTILAATNYAAPNAAYALAELFGDESLHGGFHGVSDHTVNPSPDLYRKIIKNGASMIERHIHLPDVESHDDEFASTPDEMKTLFDAARSEHEAAHPS